MNNKIPLNNSLLASDLKLASKSLPNSTGVYLYKDENNKVIYIGKANNLKSRVMSYFSSKEIRDIRIAREILTIDFMVTNSEQESLLLEDTLIKRYKPKFNVRLKDDKSFPFIKINTTEKFPQVYITRNVQQDGAKYFGPYANASNLRKTLNLLNKLFPYRSCTKKITGNDPKPCLEFHINRCIAPCSGESSAEEYKKVIDQTISFLEGDTKSTLKQLNKSMWDASESQKFEQAISIRDNINAINSLSEKQSAITSKTSNLNADAIDVAQNKYETWVDVLIIRDGKIKSREHFQMEVQEFHTNEVILSSFLKKFYLNNTNIPQFVICPTTPSEVKDIEKLLNNSSNKKVSIEYPKRGRKKEIADFLSKNIRKWVEYREIKIDADEKKVSIGIQNLQDQLNLSNIPNRIECYDISHIQGTSVVGSMIVFEKGKPNKSEYRRFEIKKGQKNDDFAALKEVFERRCIKFIDNPGEKVPDLMLVDGGKGQLNITHQVLLNLGLNNIDIASIAKKKEEIFMPNNFESIILNDNSEGKFLLQMIRDEAHRFAITYHRKKRSKAMIASSLDAIPGIGPKKKKILINTFGSTENIRNIKEEEVYKIQGISKLDAKLIKDLLN